MIQVQCFKDASAKSSAVALNHHRLLLCTSPAPTARPLDSGARDFGDASGWSANWKVGGSIPDGPRASPVQRERGDATISNNGKLSLDRRVNDVPTAVPPSN